MVWWNQRKFQKSKFHFLTGVNICTRFSTSQHNEQNLHCWASSFQHFLFPKNKQRDRKKNPPQKMCFTCLKCFHPVLELLLLWWKPSDVGKPLSGFLLNKWVNQSEQSTAHNSPPPASRLMSPEVYNRPQWLAVTEMAMKPPVALLTSLCFKRSLLFLLVLSLTVFLCTLHVHLC